MYTHKPRKSEEGPNPKLCVGLITYQLSPEEHEAIKKVPPPRSYKNIETTAPQRSRQQRTGHISQSWTKKGGEGA